MQNLIRILNSCTPMLLYKFVTEISFANAKPVYLIPQKAFIEIINHGSARCAFDIVCKMVFQILSRLRPARDVHLVCLFCSRTLKYCSWKYYLYAHSLFFLCKVFKTWIYCFLQNYQFIKRTFWLTGKKPSKSYTKIDNIHFRWIRWLHSSIGSARLHRLGKTVAGSTSVGSLFFEFRSLYK